MTAETNSNIKTERLEARLSKEQKELFQRAADILGLTLTDFTISSLQVAAKQAIQEHEIMTLSYLILQPLALNYGLRLNCINNKWAYK